MSDSRQLYDDDHNMDEVRRGMQSGLQRGIDNLFNRIRQLEIVDVKRKHDLEQHISADREHLLHNLSLSEDLRIWLETIDARISALESRLEDPAILPIVLDDSQLVNEVRIVGVKTPAPTTRDSKRAEVAEAFLHAALLCPNGRETTYANLAYILATPESPYHNNTIRDMARVLHYEWITGNNNE